MRDEYEDRRERQREERRHYEADVSYDVWRSGGNPDAIDHDRVLENYDRSNPPDVAADRELQCQRQARDRRREEQQEEQPEQGEG